MGPVVRVPERLWASRYAVLPDEAQDCSVSGYQASM
jgi:hypothetical protein